MRRIAQLTFAAALAAFTAQAGIVITFDQSTKTVQPGDLVHFTGVIANTGSDEVFLNFDGFTPPPGDFTLNDQFINVPLSLLGTTDTGSIDLFDLQVGSPAFGFYGGSYLLYGSANDEANDLLASANFSVNVVPEPGSAMLLAIGVALGAAWKKRLGRR